MSIIPRAIELKCEFAERKLKNVTIPDGKKIKKESIIVSTIRIINPVKNATIWFFVTDDAKSPIAV